MAGGFYSRAEIQQAMDLMVGERLRGRPDQSIYEASPVQNFKIGARRQVKDSWVFHYAQAKAAMDLDVYTGRLRSCQKAMLAANELVLTVAAPAGQRFATIPDAVSPENYYQGGVAAFWTVAGKRDDHRIASSTASDGTKVILTLEENLLTTMAIGDNVTPMPSIYKEVGPMGVTYPTREYAVGITKILVPIDYFFWLLTYGPISISCQASGWPEDAGSCMDAFAWQDGTIAHLKAWPAGTYDGAGTSPQRVGTGLFRGNYGTGRIMLQLDP